MNKTILFLIHIKERKKKLFKKICGINWFQTKHRRKIIQTINLVAREKSELERPSLFLKF